MARLSRIRVATTFPSAISTKSRSWPSGMATKREHGARILESMAGSRPAPDATWCTEVLLGQARPVRRPNAGFLIKVLVVAALVALFFAKFDLREIASYLAWDNLVAALAIQPLVI